MPKRAASVADVSLQISPYLSGKATPVPATPEQEAALGSLLGAVPPELLELYRFAANLDEVLPDADGYEWLPLEAAVNETEMLRKESGNAAALFTLAHDRGSDFACLDGKSGRIVFWDHETRRATKLAADLATFLRGSLKEAKELAAVRKEAALEAAAPGSDTPFPDRPKKITAMPNALLMKHDREGSIASLAFLESTDQLAVGCAGSLSLVAVGKEGERAVETGGAGVAFDLATSRLFAADCDEVALTSTRETGVELSWLPGTFRVWPRARVAARSVRRGAKVVIAPGGELAAVRSYDPAVTLWGMNDFPRSEPPANLETTRAKPTFELEAGKPRATMIHPADVHRLRFSPDAKRLATLSCDDLCLWDTGTGAKQAAWKGAEWYGLDFAPDGQRLFIGANTDVDNVQIFDRDGKRLGGWSAPYRVLDLRLVSPTIIATLGLDWLSLHDLETGVVHCKIKRKRYKANRWNDSAIADVRGDAIITLSPAAILRVTG